MAVRTPASADVDEDDFSCKARIVVRHLLAVQIREIEMKWLSGILNARMLRRIGWFRKSLRARGVRAIPRRLLFPVQNQLQSAVGIRGHFKYCRTQPRKMAQDELRSIVRSVERSCISVHAQNRSRCLVPLLLHDE